MLSQSTEKKQTSRPMNSWWTRLAGWPIMILCFTTLLSGSFVRSWNSMITSGKNSPPWGRRRIFCVRESTVFVLLIETPNPNHEYIELCCSLFLFIIIILLWEFTAVSRVNSRLLLLLLLVRFHDAVSATTCSHFLTFITNSHRTSRENESPAETAQRQHRNTESQRTSRENDDVSPRVSIGENSDRSPPFSAVTHPFKCRHCTSEYCSDKCMNER